MTPPNNSDGPQTDSVAQDQLQSFVRRIEALEDEIAALNGDKSEVYKDAKGNGFDTKVLRKVIADRRKDATERNEFDAVYQIYWDAIHGVVRAHVENIEEFDPETGEVLNETPVSHGREEPGTTDGAASAGETADNSEAASELVAHGMEAADHGSVATHGAAAPQAANPGGEDVARTPAHAPEQPGQDNGSVRTPAEGGANSAAISADRTKPNPWCEDPDDCGVEASWNHMCGSCLRRRDAQRSAAEAMH